MNLIFYMKKVILFILVILTTYQSKALIEPSQRRLIAQNDELESLDQDTTATFRGKIVDSITTNPIPFVKIILYKNSDSIMTMSNMKGEFSFNIEGNKKTKIFLSAIGYENRVYDLICNQNNLFRLKPEDNLLSDVIVSASIGKNGERIIKKISQNIAKNYGNFSFDQTFKAISIVYNYDTLKCELKDLIELHIAKEFKYITSKKWQKDTVINNDSAFSNFIGVPVLSSNNILLNADIIRKGLLADKINKNINYRLLTHYKDKKGENVYRIGFKPLKSFFVAAYANSPLSYFKGEMLVREKDYAIINIKYTEVIDLDHKETSLKKLYRSPYWKFDKVSKIIPNSLIYNGEVSYIKDPIIGKYFVHVIKGSSYETGYQVEENRDVQLNYQIDIKSCDIKNVNYP